ncbi:hypothetical protein STEG23_016706 [Scotinomys teguina]
MCRPSWFLDPGGWSETAAVGLHLISPGLGTLTLRAELKFKRCRLELHPEDNGPRKRRQRAAAIVQQSIDSETGRQQERGFGDSCRERSGKPTSEELREDPKAFA